MADITNITLNGTNYTLKASGGSGGETVVELTQAQYDALSAYAPDTTYIITDATPINMDDYATTASTSGIPAMQQDIATLSGSVANKADKASVSANTYRQFPKWNTQGVITGTTGNTVFARSLSINGTSKTMLQETNSDFTGIYAPTSAGTQNAPLLSNGSGAPVWASFKFWYGTESQYEAITTKDSSTIYFVKPD